MKVKLMRINQPLEFDMSSQSCKAITCAFLSLILFHAPSVQSYGQLIPLEVITDRFTFLDVKTGTPAFETLWESVEPFNEGFAVVYDGNDLGLINEEGKYVLPPDYKTIKGVSEGVAVLEDNMGIWHVFTVDGKIRALPEYSTLGKMSDGVMSYRLKNSNERGFVDIDGRRHPIIIQGADEFELLDFHQGHAMATPRYIINRSFQIANDKYNVDPNGMDFPFCTENIFHNGMFFEYVMIQSEESSQETFIGINLNGDTVIQPGYGLVNFLAACHISPRMESGRIRVRNEDFLHGFIDGLGNMRIPTIYTYAYNFSEGLAAVEIDSSYIVFINPDGKQAFSTRFYTTYVKKDEQFPIYSVHENENPTGDAVAFKNGFATLKCTEEHDKSRPVQVVINTKGEVIHRRSISLDY